MNEVELTVKIIFRGEEIKPDDYAVIAENVMKALKNQVANYGIAPEESEYITDEINITIPDTIVNLTGYLL